MVNVGGDWWVLYGKFKLKSKGVNMDILEKIVLRKRGEVLERRGLVPMVELTRSVYFKEPCFSLRKSLRAAGSTGIIAEFKRKSPSLGWIKEGADVADITSGYAVAGAAGLSVLTDTHFFGGSSGDLRAARRVNSIPILRKDFIIDEYQLFEAKAMGADVVLLIAECLTKEEIKGLSGTARSLGLEVLMELHSEMELDKVCDTVDCVGINNRNLKTFEVNIGASIELSKLIPDRFVKVAESGITNPLTINELRTHGFEGFLIGEAFMKTADPGAALRGFVELLKK